MKVANVALDSTYAVGECGSLGGMERKEERERMIIGVRGVERKGEERERGKKEREERHPEKVFFADISSASCMELSLIFFQWPFFVLLTTENKFFPPFPS